MTRFAMKSLLILLSVVQVAWVQEAPEPFQTPERCLQDPEPGPCGEYNVRWFYNPQVGKCLRFLYRGCDGNENNFENPGLCMRTCHTGAPESSNEEDELDDISGDDMDVAGDHDILSEDASDEDVLEEADSNQEMADESDTDVDELDDGTLDDSLIQQYLNVGTGMDPRDESVLREALSRFEVSALQESDKPTDTADQVEEPAAEVEDGHGAGMADTDEEDEVEDELDEDDDGFTDDNGEAVDSYIESLGSAISPQDTEMLLEAISEFGAMSLQALDEAEAGVKTALRIAQAGDSVMSETQEVAQPDVSNQKPDDDAPEGLDLQEEYPEMSRMMSAQDQQTLTDVMSEYEVYEVKENQQQQTEDSAANLQATDSQENVEQASKSVNEEEVEEMGEYDGEDPIDEIMRTQKGVVFNPRNADPQDREMLSELISQYEVSVMEEKEQEVQHKESKEENNFLESFQHENEIGGSEDNVHPMSWNQDKYIDEDDRKDQGEPGMGGTKRITIMMPFRGMFSQGAIPKPPSMVPLRHPELTPENNNNDRIPNSRPHIQFPFPIRHTDLQRPLPPASSILSSNPRDGPPPPMSPLHFLLLRALLKPKLTQFLQERSQLPSAAAPPPTQRQLPFMLQSPRVEPKMLRAPSPPFRSEQPPMWKPGHPMPREMGDFRENVNIIPTDDRRSSRPAIMAPNFSRNTQFKSRKNDNRHFNNVSPNNKFTLLQVFMNKHPNQGPTPPQTVLPQSEQSNIKPEPKYQPAPVPVPSVAYPINPPMFPQPPLMWHQPFPLPFQPPPYRSPVYTHSHDNLPGHNHQQYPPHNNHHPDITPSHSHQPYPPHNHLSDNLPSYNHQQYPPHNHLPGNLPSHSHQQYPPHNHLPGNLPSQSHQQYPPHNNLPGPSHQQYPPHNHHTDNLPSHSDQQYPPHNHLPDNLPSHSHQQYPPHNHHPDNLQGYNHQQYPPHHHHTAHPEPHMRWNGPPQYRRPEIPVRERQVLVVTDEEDETVDHYACLLPLAPGKCKSYQTKWYYNRDTAQCQIFYFTGCGGNANNFETWEECAATCLNPTGPRTTVPGQNIEDASSTTDEAEQETIIMTSTVLPETEEEQQQALEEQSRDSGEKAPSVEQLRTTVETPVDVVEDDSELAMEDEDTLELSSPDQYVLEKAPTVTTEYIVLMAVMASVGLAVVVLVTVSIVHLSRKMHKSKKERVLEAVINQQLCGDLPKMVNNGKLTNSVTQEA